MSKFSFLFGQPHLYNCEWNCIYVGITNSKPPGPTIMKDQSQILSRSQVQFITLFFWRCTTVFARTCSSHLNAVYPPRQSARLWCRKTHFRNVTGTFSIFQNKVYCLESHTEHWWRCSRSTSKYTNKNLRVFNK